MIDDNWYLNLLVKLSFHCSCRSSMRGSFHLGDFQTESVPAWNRSRWTSSDLPTSSFQVSALALSEPSTLSADSYTLSRILTRRFSAQSTASPWDQLFAFRTAFWSARGPSARRPRRRTSSKRGPRICSAHLGKDTANPSLTIETSPT